MNLGELLQCVSPSESIRLRYRDTNGCVHTLLEGFKEDEENKLLAYEDYEVIGIESMSCLVITIEKDY